MFTTAHHRQILQSWHDALSQPRAQAQNASGRPDYWQTLPSTTLQTSTQIDSVHFGTGASIFDAAILPAIAGAEQEVTLVTCFLARSATLTGVNSTLVALAAKARQRGRPIRVRFCFSSSSLWQKLTHTRSLRGKTWPAHSWQATLGLPMPEQLRGLDLCVKSVFVLPFSVMHPKFVIIDRRRVFLPSCNVSWENWFEGCVEMRGKELVAQFVRFYQSFWADGEDDVHERIGNWDSTRPDASTVQARPPPLQGSRTLSSTVFPPSLSANSHPALFLPSPHHANPRPFSTAPSTPLNAFLLTLFATAQSQIYIQTPNLTCSAVLRALLDALERGVDVSIVTSEKLMWLEQVVTAWTTTPTCVKRLTRAHAKLLLQKSTLTVYESSPTAEAGRGTASNGTLVGNVRRCRVGRLTIAYYRPSMHHTSTATPLEGRPQRVGAGKDEPVQSHLKLTVVDGETVVLGSGNMDRASWFTSQELGVAIFDSGFAGEVLGKVSRLMNGEDTVERGGSSRKNVVYDRGEEGASPAPAFGELTTDRQNSLD